MGNQVRSLNNSVLDSPSNLDRWALSQPEPTRKKVLLHLHTPPIPTDGGDKRRLLGTLQYFRDRQPFFSVDVVVHNGFRNPVWTPEKKQEILQFVDRIFVYEGERNFWDFVYSRSQSFYYQTLLNQQLPIDSDYYTPPGYVRFVRSLLTQQTYDYFWINYLEYAHLAVQSKAARTQFIIDIHDIACQGRLARKNVYPLKGRTFDYGANFAREVALLNQFDAVVVNSQQEMIILEDQLPTQKLRFVPHLVEGSADSTQFPPYQNRKFEYDLLFVGTGLGPNVEGLQFFLDQIFPKIIRQKPDVKFAIAGTVSQSVQIDSVLAPHMTCLGFVSNLSEIYLKSRIMICPLLSGAGTKVKLQEAMAHAIPIVTTTTGASGMSLIDGINALITDEPDRYADQILRLLNEPELAQLLSQRIDTTFQHHYSNRAVYSTIDQLFQIPS
ncbi:glycosyltransferase family 4 protein [Kovacikia minuta CCNUW1]|uniref:glycosyltransferase n=1 Tax=Kovacikia minuta TaxID=2931930 RepID=UPI001CCA453C|nr:glycosyltransferase [Kovacikia minuta]UBF27180.1 glycosyltransferase family 4 protein [Kovacikia minuta CCNUW1]